MLSYIKYVTASFYISSLLLNIISTYNWTRLLWYIYKNRKVANNTKLSALSILYLIASLFINAIDIPHGVYMSVMWRPGKKIRVQIIYPSPEYNTPPPSNPTWSKEGERRSVPYSNFLELVSIRYHSAFHPTAGGINVQ